MIENLKQKIKILEQENEQQKQTLDRYEIKFKDIYMQINTFKSQTAIKMRSVNAQAS